VLEGAEYRTIFLGMDQFRDELPGSNVKGKNPLKDQRVRKALYQAIDIQPSSAWCCAAWPSPRVRWLPTRSTAGPQGRCALPL
jgi:hypothetical protein